MQSGTPQKSSHRFLIARWKPTGKNLGADAVRTMKWPSSASQGLYSTLSSDTTRDFETSLNTVNWERH